MRNIERVLKGGCLCGAVRYEAVGEPLYSGFCYCEDCRKASGAGAVPFMGYSKDSFQLSGETADSDEAGHAFRYEAGHRFRFEAGQGPDLMSATWRLLPRIEVMMFCPEQLVKRAWIWISAKARVAVGNGGRSALSIAP